MPLFVHAVLAALRVHRQTVEHARLPDRKVGDIDHLLHFAVALGFDLAVLQGHKTAERRLVRAQFLTQQSHDFAALGRRYPAPLIGGRHRVGHYTLVVCRGGAANLREPPAGRGIGRIEERPGLGRTPAAAAGPGARVDGVDAERRQAFLRPRGLARVRRRSLRMRTRRGWVFRR
jgi:hypothetical protein